jgi:glycolate oxidase
VLTDGNLHPLIITPAGDDAAREAAQAAFDELLTAVRQALDPRHIFNPGKG